MNYDTKFTNDEIRILFGAFHSGDFTDQVRVPGIGTVPRNVAAICLWTWECAASPRGPNEHARPIGYSVIALAFLLALWN